MQKYHSKIIKIIKETHDTFSLRFEKPDGLDYQPGQYALFEHNINGEQVKRSYSFSSSPKEKFLEITVKRMPHGKMSGYLTHLNPSDKLDFMAPLGKFVFTEDLKDVVFIAGGSGVSPFRSMIEYVLDKKLDTKITMIYGCRSPRDIILKHDLNEYNKEMDNFNLFVTVDTPYDNWKFHTGFIDADFIKESVGGVLNKVYFICGPPPMVNSVKKALLDLGVEDEDIRLDAWG